jgi:ornithine cyclodeaminase
MSSEPVIKGDWLRPGQHLNLIGAYRPDMRETDETALQRSKVYVDSFDTTLDHIGELKIPLAEGAIERGHVLADFYGIDGFETGGAEDITLFKNGGGAHLDLMTGRYILDCWQAARQSWNDTNLDG